MRNTTLRFHCGSGPTALYQVPGASEQGTPTRLGPGGKGATCSTSTHLTVVCRATGLDEARHLFMLREGGPPAPACCSARGRWVVGRARGHGVLTPPPATHPVLGHFVALWCL